MGRLTASYDAGVGGARLVGDTIGVALAKMVEAQPDVDALVSRHQGVRLSYGDQVHADVPVVHVLEARPTAVKADVEKLASESEKKR